MQKCGVSDKLHFFVFYCTALVSNQSASYQGRRDVLQWASFPETSRVFSFSAGMLILNKVEYMLCNVNFTFSFTHRYDVKDLLISCMYLLSMSTWA